MNESCCCYINIVVFQSNVIFLYPLKTSEKYKCSRRYIKFSINLKPKRHEKIMGLMYYYIFYRVFVKGIPKASVIVKCNVFYKANKLIFKELCCLQFLKNKICLNRTKSLLIVNKSNIMCKSNEDFAMEQCSVI